MEDANLRKQAEQVSRTLRKEKQQSEQKLTDSKDALTKSGELVETYRELHKFSNEQFDALVENAEKKSDVTKVPHLDEDLLKFIEASVPDEDEKGDSEETKDDAKDSKAAKDSKPVKASKDKKDAKAKKAKKAKKK